MHPMACYVHFYVASGALKQIDVNNHIAAFTI